VCLSRWSSCLLMVSPKSTRPCVWRHHGQNCAFVTMETHGSRLFQDGRARCTTAIGLDRAECQTLRVLMDRCLDWPQLADFSPCEWVRTERENVNCVSAVRHSPWMVSRVPLTGMRAPTCHPSSFRDTHLRGRKKRGETEEKNRERKKKREGEEKEELSREHCQIQNAC
jgi:hypothetical protein